MVIAFPPGWLEGHPLSSEDLAQQGTQLARLGFTLEFTDLATGEDAKRRAKKEKKKKKKKEKKEKT